MMLYKYLLLPFFLFCTSIYLEAQQSEKLKPPPSEFYTPPKNTKIISGITQNNLIDPARDTLTYFADISGGIASFLFWGQDWLLQWFSAPTDLKIEGVGIACYDNHDSIKVEIRIVKLNWSQEQLKNAGDNNWGYYPAGMMAVNGITAFYENPDRKGEWVNLSNQNVEEPFGDFIWIFVDSVLLSSNGYSGYNWIDIPDPDSQPKIKKNEIFAIAIKNVHPIPDAGTLSIRAANFSNLPNGWKFYANGRYGYENSLGWWSRNFTFDFAAAVNLLGPTQCTINYITLLESTLSTDPRKVCVEILCLDNSEIDSVFLNYSVDHAEFIKILLEQKDSITWCGLIPGQIRGTTIEYFISVVDIYGNVKESSRISYSIFMPTPGTNTIVVFNKGGGNVTGYPADYYFGSDDFVNYTPYGFVYDKWGYGGLFKKLLDHYKNVIEIASTDGPRDYNDDVIREWLTASPDHNYALFGQEWLGARYNFEDKDFNTGDFEYDILGITHSYNDISYNGGRSNRLPTPIFPIPNFLLGGELYNLFQTQPTDSLQYDPFYELNKDNWIDGFEVLAENEKDIYALSRGLKGIPYVDTFLVATHRTLPAGNKIVFMSFDPLAINSAPDYYWYGFSKTSPQVQTMLWFGETVDVDESIKIVPNEFVLYQNYPNPFNSTTKIKFTIPPVETGHAPSLLRIYDILGREIATLVNEEKPSGTYEVTFDASNLSLKGSILTSGIYYYQLRAGDFVETKKMILLR